MKKRPPKKKFKCERFNVEPSGQVKPSYYYLIAWDGTDYFDLQRITYHEYHVLMCPVLPEGAANLIFSSLK